MPELPEVETIVREIAPRLEAVPERLICSGLLAAEADDVCEAFAARGLVERHRRAEGDWVAASLSKATSS